MRILTMTALLVATAATPAIAQTPAPQPRVQMPRPGGHMQAPRPNPGNWQGQRMRWGGNVNGRWYGGVHAPGGWNAYRRPVRGWVLPSYWYAPSFFITDYSTYGLGAPQAGYTWSRYYDDAVLVDGSGRIYDTRSGIQWDRYDDGYAYRDDGYDGGYDVSHQGGYVDGGYRKRDDGVGGAVIGGVVGGVAGNVIAGRGDKLGGTLIGAGVGAIAGAAIDRAEDKPRRVVHRVERRYPEPAYGADYGEPGRDHPRPYPEPVYRDGPHGPPPVVYSPRGEIVQGTGRDRAETYVERREIYRDDGPSYHVGGPGYDARPYTTVVRGPGVVTTTTVIPAVTTTTTTTEYYYESAPTYRRVVKRWRPQGKLLCRCK